MSVTKESVDRLMKRCQIGCGGRQALDDAHDILAECYGTLGALVQDRDALRARIDDAATVTMIGISPTAGYLGYTNPSGGFFESSFEDCPECPILGKRVALVPVDE